MSFLFQSNPRKREGEREWKDTVRQAARSVTLVLHNYSPLVLVQESVRVAHGTWCLFPPEQIEPYAEVECAVTNTGFMGGTEGSLSFRTQQPPFVLLVLRWVNPYVGAKSALVQLKGDAVDTSAWQTSVDFSRRHQMDATFVFKRLEPVSPSPSPPPSLTATPPPVAKSPPSPTPPLVSSAWRQPLLAAFRSCVVIINNRTDRTLHRSLSAIPSGRWARAPVEVVPAQGSVECGLYSKNALSGVHGQVRYGLEGSPEELQLDFENPVIGACRFVCHDSPSFALHVTTIPGEHATAIYEVTELSDLPLAQSLSQSQSLSLSRSASRGGDDSSLSGSMTSSFQSSRKNIQRQFGVPLTVLLEREGHQADLPLLVSALVSHLAQCGANCTDIFRKPGSFADTVRIRHLVEHSDIATIDFALFETRTVAFCLKTFLRELPQAIIPASVSAFFVSFLMEDMAEHISFVDFYTQFVMSLPQERRAVLAALCSLLHDLHTAPASPLSAPVAAVLFGPILVPEGQTDREVGLASFLETTPMVCQSLQMLIEHFPLIFFK